MKIALAHKRLDLKGGTERDFYRTAEGLRDLGHQVHLFCSEYAVEPPPGILAHRVPVLPLGRTARLWSFAALAPRITQRYPCDIVMGFGRMLRQDILRCGGGSHRGFLHRLGGEGGAARRLWQRVSVYHQSVLSIEKRQFRATRFKTILAVSGQVKRDLMDHYSVPADRIVVLYNGVDALRFHPSRRPQVRAAIRKQWEIPLAAPLVLFVGSGFRRKGLDRLLSAWNAPRIREMYLLVVGDDARMRRYQAWAKSLSPSRIIFTGRQPAVEDYYAAADAVALPSVQEAFGNVVLEALASGLPVLVSRAVGAAELLRGALAEGIVDHAEDRSELASKLAQVLERGQDPRCRVEARQIGEEFSWPNHFRKLEAVLMETRAAIRRERDC